MPLINQFQSFANQLRLFKRKVTLQLIRPFWVEGCRDNMLTPDRFVLPHERLKSGIGSTWHDLANSSEKSQLDGTLRVAAGVSLGTSIDGGGLDLSPTGSFRWNITEDLTLRDHGFGVQLEYRLTPNVELFASGYRTTDEYRLRDVSGAPDELTFRDRQVLVGAGFEWKLSRRLRLNLEAGAVSWRKVRLHSDDLGTLVSQRGDPSPYLELRLEVRP